MAQYNSISIIMSQLDRTQVDARISQNTYQMDRLKLEQHEAELKLNRVQEEMHRVRLERVKLEGMRYALVEDLWYKIFDILLLEDDPLIGADTSSDNFYRAITLSHVCRAWRALLLSKDATRYWTRLLFRGDISDPRALAALEGYQQRSKREGAGSVNAAQKEVPLHLVFLPSLTAHQLQELPLLKKQIDYALSNLVFERAPWGSLTCESRDAAGMMRFIRGLSSFFPHLRSLHLSLDKPYSGHMEPSADTSEMFISGPYKIEHLYLQHITPVRFPLELFAGVRHATLKHAGRERCLRLSHLTKFARHASLLKTLILDGSPRYDISIPTPLSVLLSSAHPDHPILLQNLTELKWGILHPKEIHQLLLFFDTPYLRALTLYLRNTSGGYDLAQTLYLDKPLEYRALTVLHLHYADSTALVWRLKSMVFPVLQRLSINNDDFEEAGGKDRNLPALTNFPSLFHVPAMPALTHLSLFRVSLTPEWGDKTLSYLPALRCLELDACTGTEDLFSCLGATSMVMGTWAPVCPFLDELVLSDCLDLRFQDLVALVKKRNVPATALQTLRGGSEDSSPFSTPRKIKALRKGVAGSPNVSLRKRSPMDISDDEVKPSKIVKVDVRICPDVSRADLESLWDLGVNFVCGDRRGRWVTEVTWKT